MGQSLHHAIPDLVKFENAERLVQERSEGGLSDEIGTYDTGAEAGSKTHRIQKTVRIDREKLDAHHRKRVVEKTVSLNAEVIAAALNRWRTQAVTEPETELEEAQRKTRQCHVTTDTRFNPGQLSLSRQHPWGLTRARRNAQKLGAPGR